MRPRIYAPCRSPSTMTTPSLPLMSIPSMSIDSVVLSSICFPSGARRFEDPAAKNHDDGWVGARATPPRLAEKPVHGSLHRRQGIGTAAGNYPPCKRVAIPAELADPLCRGKLIESHFHDGIGEFRLGGAEFTPNHQAIGTVRLARSIGGVKGNAKFFVHTDPHSEVL